MTDPALLRVYQNLLDAVAEEMGSALERTGYSPNIKERRDYSCAVFDASGEMIAQAAHNPVHLGSTPLSVREAIDSHGFEPGDVILLNDPYRGGTHLPDLTVVSGVFEDGRDAPTFFVANRAHHADVGGAVRGSMALFTEIYQEGLRIPPVLLRRRGETVVEVEAMLLANMRQPEERLGDLRAQLNANEVGRRGMERLLRGGDRAELSRYCDLLQDAAEQHVTTLLSSIPDGEYHAEEFLDDDGVNPDSIRLAVAVTVREGRASFDFTGTAPQVAGCLNTNPAVVLSAVFYVLRALAGDDIPANAGCMRPVEVTIPPGSLLDPALPAAVAGGNVETSQRLVDLLLLAFSSALAEKIPAQSQGTMNNITFGSAGGGRRAFSYYETIGGGAGAGSWGAGASAVHSHMTNTRNTPVEVLEHSIPVRVREYRVRRGSGGAGAHSGGDGIVRSVEALESMHCAILSERRLRPPAGSSGGDPGRCGSNSHIRGERVTELPGKWMGNLEPGDVVCIETPGGGGWGQS